MRTPIQREELVLQSWRFTNLSALVREVLELLEHSDYKIDLHLRPLEWERLSLELESVRTLGRLRLRVKEEEQYI